VESQIFLHTLNGILSPQKLKLIGYIKHHKFIILIDKGNSHNFIHRHVTQETHFYMHAVNNIWIMISNDGSMKCGDILENFTFKLDIIL
jgi:hypothetical protein